MKAYIECYLATFQQVVKRKISVKKGLVSVVADQLCYYPRSEAFASTSSCLLYKVSWSMWCLKKNKKKIILLLSRAPLVNIWKTLCWRFCLEQRILTGRPQTTSRPHANFVSPLITLNKTHFNQEGRMKRLPTASLVRERKYFKRRKFHSWFVCYLSPRKDPRLLTLLKRSYTKS